MNEDLKKHITLLLAENLRFDNRKSDEYRKVSIEYGVVKSAEGSARVKIGDTEVLAGVKLEIGSPYPDKPDEGTIIVGVELLPLSNPEFELGPPSIDAIELARVVDRGVREAKSIDFKGLCIEKGEKVWLLVIDICPMNDSGNLFDASSLAVIAALKDTVFPEVEDGRINYKKKTDKKLELKNNPVEVTVSKIGKNFIVDATTDEEKVIDARLTIASLEDGSICALQKGGTEPLTEKDIDDMASLAISKAKELRKLL